MNTVFLNCMYSFVWASMVCAPAPLDKKCVEEQFDILIHQKMLISMDEIATIAANNCVMDSSGSCSWHFGNDYCGENNRWICGDGFESGVRCR